MQDKIRIALHIIIGKFDGGAFQYALATCKALASLDKNKYEIVLWYDCLEWQEIAEELGFLAYDNNSYIVAQEQAEECTALYQKLYDESLSYQEKEEILAILNPYLAKHLISQFSPHLLIIPHQGRGIILENVPSIYVVHDLMHRYQTSFPEIADTANIIGRENNNVSLIAAASMVFVDSELGKKHVMECYKAHEDKIKVLAFTAFGDILTCQECKPEHNLSGQDLPSQGLPDKFFFYPAQFWSHKNHKNIALAVERMRFQYPDVHVVLTGDIHKNGYADFANFIEAFGLEKHFSILGYKSTEEIAWLYKNARALIYPTYAGPTNIPPLEAMALACPCAVSDIFAMREECTDAALYFDPASTFSLMKAMQSLWSDDELCASLRIKGLELSANYTIQDFNSRFLNYVHEAISQHYPNLIK